MPVLKPDPKLSDYQNYVKELEDERGFDHQSAKDKCLMLVEEVGELLKAVRKKEGLKIDPNSEFSDIGDEIADVFIFLCSIANRYSVDMEAAFRDKEKINHTRKWESID